MILAIDVYYEEDKYKAVGICFKDWKDINPSKVYIKEVPLEKDIQEYIPGQFYKRELQPVLSIVQLYQKEEKEYPEIIVVDGFVTLKNNEGEESKGLGEKLKESLNNPNIKVVGVAKNKYGRCDEISGLVYRGKSRRPLYVQPPEYAQKIQEMKGEYRIPTLLKRLDKYTKNRI